MTCMASPPPRDPLAPASLRKAPICRRETAGGRGAGNAWVSAAFRGPPARRRQTVARLHPPCPPGAGSRETRPTKFGRRPAAPAKSTANTMRCVTGRDAVESRKR